MADDFLVNDDEDGNLMLFPELDIPSTHQDVNGLPGMAMDVEQQQQNETDSEYATSSATGSDLQQASMDSGYLTGSPTGSDNSEQNPLSIGMLKHSDIFDRSALCNFVG